jgi:ATP-dependent RNA helicase DDX42
LFSATFKKKVEKLAREILADPIRIIQGELGEANENITQIVKVFPEGPQKWQWLNSKLVEFLSSKFMTFFFFSRSISFNFIFM